MHNFARVKTSVHAVLLVMALSTWSMVDKVQGLTCYCTTGECSDSNTWPKEICQDTPPLSLFNKNVPKMKKRLLDEITKWEHAKLLEQGNPTNEEEIMRVFKKKLKNQPPQNILRLNHGLINLYNDENRLQRLGMSADDVEKKTYWRKQEILDMNATMLDGYYEKFCLKSRESDGTTSKGCGHYITQLTGLQFKDGCHKQINMKLAKKSPALAHYCRCSSNKCNWGEVTGIENENREQVGQTLLRSASTGGQISASLVVCLISTVVLLLMRSYAAV